jgi:PPIC-type PPIASE domain
MIRRLLREPLVHFAAIGAAIFIAYRVVAPPAIEQAEIVVTADRVASLTAQFRSTHDGRPPRDIELKAAIDAYVRDEMLYREGLALGLDRGDPVVRSRVRQKADILTSDALGAEPTERDLQVYLEQHRSEFDIPARVSFEQVYFDPAKHRDDLAPAVAAARAALAAGARVDLVGDRTLLPATMAEALPEDIRAAFGEEFRKQLTGIDADGWQGPLATTFGVHLVRITGRGQPTHPTLADARDVVTREWSRAHAATMKEEFYRRLAQHYTIRIDQPAVAQAAVK